MLFQQPFLCQMKPYHWVIARKILRTETLEKLDVCVTVHHYYYDVSNQQDATTFSFINLFKSALHVSGDKFTHPQEHSLTVYTAFGTMHRHCCRPVPRGTGRQQCRCIAPKAVYTDKECSWGWANLSPETFRADLKRINKRKNCCILLVAYIVVGKLIAQ